MSSVLRRPDAFALDSHTRDEIALFLAKAALAAGPAVMEEYDRGCEVASKADGSPVTSADQRAEAIISDYLTRLTPSTPLCAEEATAAGAKPQVAERFLLVDPLDGTREFLAGNGEFTINVALMENGAPIAGAVYAPAIGRLWVGGDTAFACEVQPGGDLPGQGSHGGAFKLAARPRAWSLLQAVRISTPSRTPSSKDCPLGRPGSRVRR